MYKNEEWLKLHTKTFDNKLFKSMLADGLESSRMVLTWIQLLVLARKINNKGRISIDDQTPYTIKSLGAELVLAGAKNEKFLRKSLKIFQEKGMIFFEKGFIQIINWELYQSADRLEEIREKDRERKKPKQGNNSMENSTENGDISTESPLKKESIENKDLKNESLYTSLDAREASAKRIHEVVTIYAKEHCLPDVTEEDISLAGEIFHKKEKTADEEIFLAVVEKANDMQQAIKISNVPWVDEEDDQPIKRA